MPDSATLNHAARVLTTVSPELHADVALRRYTTTVRSLGGREKRAVSQAVFAYFRWIEWLDPKASQQKRVEQAWAMHERFRQTPTSVKGEALAALAVPGWLREEVVLPVDTLRQIQREPALWIRARPGKAPSLAAALGNCEAARQPFATLQPLTALRYAGSQDLFLTAQFHNGEFEIQDLASQLVGHACAPLPGQTWWDACSGEGGKLLHLADMMFNKGVIWATDRSERRLQSLKRRAARAKLFNYRAALWDGSSKLPTKTKFDGILLDAPCSGVGTWQRNPHARWTTTIQDVRELAVVQRRMLEAVAGSLKIGGRLVYSVCTLTRSETTDVVKAFTAAHPELEPVAAFPASDQAAIPLSSPACAVSKTDTLADAAVTLWPHDLNANGMFIAAWRRRS